MGSPSIIFAAFAALGCSAPQVSSFPDVTPGRYEKAVTSGGQKRTYILRVPKAYDRTKPTPLVVVLHGWTGSGMAAETYTGMAAAAEKEGWVAAFPNGTNDPRGWNTGFLNLGIKGVDDVQFISDLLDQVGKSVNVNPDRIYVVGHSNGAMLANLVAAKLSDRIAAIASVAGTIGLKDVDIPTPKSPVSVLLIHGRRDNMVAYDRTANALLRGVSAMETAEWWAKQIGAGEPVITMANSHSVSAMEQWPTPSGSAEVELITITNWQHDWPVADKPGGIDGTATVMDFLRRHTKARR